MSKNVKRIFNDFKPENYVLDLRPNKDKMTFEGTVVITGKKTGRPSKRLTLHQKGLVITDCTVQKNDRTGVVNIEIERTNNHNNYDELRIHTKSLVYPGQYTITLNFKGKISPQMNGMYPCNFEDNEHKKMLIATQFESHHAREVFPCVDEPEAKATFDLTLTTPNNETVIANTPIKSQKPNKDLTTTVFETTPIMSTYLLAFVYGDMGYKEAKTKAGVTVRTYATPANVKYTDFALDVAVKCLDFYNDYFGIPYPLEKCDMIALPDFASGAMENWSCITYREQCMLVDPKNTSLPTKQYVAMVVAHELAHQWFGNLVTMRWWTDLWLNEGFASWIEYMAVDHIFPEWQMWTQFSVDEQHRAFKLDALEHTHPIEVPIKHPDEIRSIFDTISYSKGASVIHMLHAYLGANSFRKGLQHYLKKHSYANTDTVDLWQSLEDVSKVPVRQFMHAWTSQSGYPVVSINTEGKTTEVSQRRFYINPEHPSGSKTLWPISLQANKSFPEVLNKGSLQINVKDGDGIKLNQNQTGFFRVDYDTEQLRSLGQQVMLGKLTPLDRLGILSDVFECAKAGHTSTINALSFLESFANEDNNAVWDVIAASLGSTRNTMNDEQLRDNMKPFIIKLTSIQYKRLGWKPKKNENYFDSLLRSTIIGLNCSADENTAVKSALLMFDKAKTTEDIQADLRSTVFNTTVRVRNNPDTFNKLLEMYDSCNLSEEKTTIASALTGFKDKKLYSKALAMIKTDVVRHQDISYWIIYSFSNRFAREDTWKWLKLNWKWLDKSIGNDLSFHRFPLYAASAFSDRKFIPEYTKFFDLHRDSSLERSIDQGLETLQWQSTWRQHDLESIKSYFSSK